MKCCLSWSGESCYFIVTLCVDLTTKLTHHNIHVTFLSSHFYCLEENVITSQNVEVADAYGTLHFYFLKTLPNLHLLDLE